MWKTCLTVCVMAMALPCVVLASEESVAYDEVRGQVTSVTKRAISVEYAQKNNASYEMLLPFTQDIRLSHLRNLSELKPGDTVKVRYTQTYRENDKGEKVILNTVATDLALIRRAPTSGFSSRETP